MKELEDMNNEELLSVILVGIQTLRDNEYADGKKEKLANALIYDREVVEKKAYEQGLNDSWECARKMCLMSPEERLRAFDVSGNHLAILSDLTAPKAIAKIKAYEDNQKQDAEIKVGDEIRLHDAIEVVTSVMSTGLQTIDASGNASTWYYVTYPLETWKKTGRHFPQIIEVLEQMKGEADGYTSINRSDNI